ncbi:MAG: hypothetical protein HYX63_03300 [Gammaproteobacteria bacterium]|nr:hypothetical protein [Gammaproteobacteria bacterium]
MDWEKSMSSLFVIVGSLVTGLLALLGGWLASKSNLRQLDQRLRHEMASEKREVLRSRLEELYSLVSHWAGNMVTHHMTYQRVMVGELSYDQALDLTIASKHSGDANRLFTLADLYFPSTREALEKLKELRDEASRIQSSFKDEYKQGKLMSQQHSRALLDVLNRFNTAVREYQDALAEYASDVDPTRSTR